MAPAQVAFQRARSPLPRPPLLRRRSSRPAPWRMAPMPALPCRSRRSALRRRSLYSACPLTADRATHQPGQRRTRPAILSTAPTNPRHGATFPRLSGATSGYATEDAAVIAIRSPGAAAPLPICCRSTTCCRSPKGTARIRETCAFYVKSGINEKESIRVNEKESIRVNEKESIRVNEKESIRVNEKESIRVGPANSERWPLAAWPGPGRIGLIELNRAPMEIGMPVWGCRRSAVRARAGWGARKRTGIRALAACDEAGWSSWRADRGR